MGGSGLRARSKLCPDRSRTREYVVVARVSFEESVSPLSPSLQGPLEHSIIVSIFLKEYAGGISKPLEASNCLDNAGKVFCQHAPTESSHVSLQHV